MAENLITISILVQADVKKVWEYYTTPSHITKWNFAIDTWHCPSATNELQVGGRYMARMEAKDGSFGFDFEAIYDAIAMYKEIRFVMSDGRKVVIDFRLVDRKTEVVITFEAEQENAMELQRQGWQAILNNFKRYTEAN